MIRPLLTEAIAEMAELLPKLAALEAPLQRLAEAMRDCFNGRGKVLTCGNGGSAADAMHLAEELSIRFHKNRRALAGMALMDPAVITCAANDFGYDQIFSRQIEALGNAGDILIVFSSSGESPSVVNAVSAAKERSMLTCAFLGKSGGRLKGTCEIELLIPHEDTARIQEAQKLLFHTLCQWLDTEFD